MNTADAGRCVGGREGQVGLELLPAGSGQQDPDPAGDSNCRDPRVVSTLGVLVRRSAVCGLPLFPCRWI